LTLVGFKLGTGYGPMTACNWFFTGREWRSRADISFPAHNDARLTFHDMFHALLGALLLIPHSIVSIDIVTVTEATR